MLKATGVALHHPGKRFYQKNARSSRRRRSHKQQVSDKAKRTAWRSQPSVDVQRSRRGLMAIGDGSHVTESAPERAFFVSILTSHPVTDAASFIGIPPRFLSTASFQSLKIVFCRKIRNDRRRALSSAPRGAGEATFRLGGRGSNEIHRYQNHT